MATWGRVLGKSRDLLDIDGGRDIDSAMTDINADLHKTVKIGTLDVGILE